MAMATKTAQEAWLRCEILPGPFTTELVVIVHEVTHGKTLAIIVDRELVQADETPRAGHRVSGKVRVLRGETWEDRSNVLLPRPNEEFGSVIEVASSGLVTVR